jgi:hypothetical protein
MAIGAGRRTAGSGRRPSLPDATRLKHGESVPADMSDAGGRPCPMCERPMTHRHCKYVCPEHGVVYDCADTFY